MRAERLRDRPGKHRAEHEELAMRDVDDAHDTEHQRQAERRQRQHRRGDQAFEGGEKQVRAEGHSGAVLDRRPLAGGVDECVDDDLIVFDLVDKPIAGMRNEFASTGQDPLLAHPGEVRQSIRYSIEKSIHPPCGGWILVPDVTDYFLAVAIRVLRPSDFQASAPRFLRSHPREPLLHVLPHLVVAVDAARSDAGSRLLHLSPKKLDVVALFLFASAKIPRINSRMIWDAGRSTSAASARNASRSSGSSFMVKTASLAMTSSS